MTKLLSTMLTLFVVALAATSSLAALTGDHYCGKYMCYYITLDSTAQTATVQVASSSSIGWLGIGFGPKMTGYELNVMWINPNNTGVVLSRRKAITETLPAALPNQTAITLIKPAGSSAGNPFVSNNQLSFSYTRSQVLPESTLNTASTSFVWAYGAMKPATDSPTGVFNQHIATGSFTLNLAKPLTSPTVKGTGTATGTGVAASSTATVNGTGDNSTGLPDFSPPPTGLTDMDYMTIAHGFIMFIAWGILVPVAVFLARFGRKIDSWVKKHWIIQLTAMLLTVVGFALGFTVSAPDHAQSPHQIIGITIFIGAFTQGFLGWLIHHYFNPNRTHRPVRNYMHIFFGFGLLILAYTNIPLGFTLYNLDDSWFSAYYTWVACQGVLFLILTWFQIKQLRRIDKGEPSGADEKLTGKRESTVSQDDNIRELQRAYNPNPSHAV